MPYWIPCRCEEHFVSHYKTLTKKLPHPAEAGGLVFSPVYMRDHLYPIIILLDLNPDPTKSKVCTSLDP